VVRTRFVLKIYPACRFGTRAKVDRIALYAKFPINFTNEHRLRNWVGQVVARLIGAAANLCGDVCFCVSVTYKLTRGHAVVHRVTQHIRKDCGLVHIGESLGGSRVRSALGNLVGVGGCGKDIHARCVAFGDILRRVRRRGVHRSIALRSRGLLLLRLSDSCSRRNTAVSRRDVGPRRQGNNYEHRHD